MTFQTLTASHFTILPVIVSPMLWTVNSPEHGGRINCSHNLETALFSFTVTATQIIWMFNTVIIDFTLLHRIYICIF